jgi:hypothetical protein
MTSDLRSIEEESGDIGYPVSICNELAMELRNHIEDYAGSGITKKQMMEALTNANIYMKSINIMNAMSESTRSRVTEVNNNIAEAESRVEGHFSVIGAGENNY